MKSLITKLSLFLMLLVFGSGLHAQDVQNLSVTVSTEYAVYPTYNVTTYATVVFANASVYTLPPNSTRVGIALPSNCELDSTFNPGPGWTYVYQNPKNAYLTNTSSIPTFSSPLPGSVTSFTVPFYISGPIETALPVLVQVTMPISAIPYHISGVAPFNVANIQVQNVAPLGVQFSSFLATNKGCTNDISWSTASEKGNDYFDVERSSDAKNFISIARIPSKGNIHLMQNYSFMDANPIKGANYYRIRQTDLDKESTMTTVKMLETNCTMADISIYPNPTYNVVYLKGLAEGQTVELYNAIGQLVQKTDVKSETEAIDISKFTDGVYNIRVLRDNESIYTTKVVKR